MGNKQAPDRVPPATSINELARFFDENNTEDFDWDFVDTATHRPDGEMVHLSVSVPLREEEEIRRAAQKSGVTESAYIRMLLRKGMQEEVRGKENGSRS